MFHTARALALTVAVFALVATACGSDSPTTTGEPVSSDAPTETTTSTSSPRADELVLELVDCQQVGMNTGVDPAAAESYIVDGQELFLDAEGSAGFILIVKQCGDIVADGESQGPGHFNTAWVRTAGPAETRTLVDRPDVDLLPTDYFHPVLFQTDNAGFAEVTRSFGIPMTLADSIIFEPPGSGTQSGSATDTEIGPPLAYEWTIVNGPPFPPGDRGVVHVLSGLDDQGEALTYDIECIVIGGLVGNPGRVDFQPGSELEDLLGAGYDSMGAAPELSCVVDIVRGGVS